MRRVGVFAVLVVVAVALYGCGANDSPPLIYWYDCEQCHQQEYDKTTKPAHAGLYPRRCVACHLNTGWSPSDNTHHDILFPIRSGRHQGYPCKDCHPAPKGPLAFTCIDCHAHNRAAMDGEHGGRSGYSWSSSACLNCHPRGEQ